MPYNYEIAAFNSHTPFRCMVHHIGHVRMHTHDYFEILFILSGSCSITVEDQLFSLKASDLLVVEGHTPHELRASDCVYASVQLDQAALENNFPVPMHPSFSCNSTFPGKEKACDQLRHVIARLIQNNADEQSGYELRNWILIYQLMDVLYTYFRVERPEAADRRSHRFAQRIAEISGIINKHYTEDLPLSRVADMEHLSVPYLSKFFQEQFGMNYLSYLTQLRINHAVHELVNSEKTIEQISAESGFPNSHAFTKAFQNEYGAKPSAYRRMQKSRKKAGPAVGIEHSDYLSSLRQYLEQQPSPEAACTSVSEKQARPSISVKADIILSGKEKPLRHTWKNMIAIGKASDILIGDIQQILRRIQKEIGFRYLFFNGIFSDDMHVCSEASDKSLVFSFSYVDRLFDFLMEINLLPALSFSYMPSVLSSQPGRKLFSHPVSEPSDLKRWCGLVSAFTQHVVQRYGITCVEKWKFTVWHQPNTTPRLYGFRKDEDFYSFYKETRGIVKQLIPGAAFGMPAIFQNAEMEGDLWYHRMLSWCRENECMPDFLNFTYYDTKLSKEERQTRQTFGFVFTMVLNDSPDGLKTFISHIREDNKDPDLPSAEINLSEWNNTPSQQDLLNDTCYKSCWIIKNLLENYDRLNSFSYWSVSDLMSEAPVPREMLFGGLGLFTVNGLPKASYYALCLLACMGNQYLASGKGWFATGKNTDICIIACHYVHLSRLYATGERFIMTPTDRYTMFQSCAPLELNVHITEKPSPEQNESSRLTAGCRSYTVREYLVGREGGSLYDAWVRMGCPGPDRPLDRRLLEAASMPSMRQYTLQPEPDQSLSLQVHLEPLDVRLLILTPE